jgi:nitrate/nitrite transport system permease protein
VLPACVPHMFTGLRIGVGMSWLAIVAAEMVQGGTGIGFFIWDSYNSSLLSDTIVALLWIGMVGYALDRLVGALGRLIARS